MQETRSLKSRDDLWSGLIFVAIATAFGLESLRYDFGSGAQMGPGFIPAMLAVLLLAIGCWTIAADVVKPRASKPAPTPWRALLLISVALAVFGAFCRTLGIVPVVFVCTVLTTLASPRNKPLAALMIGLAMSVLCYVIFKVGLEITIPAFGPAFGA